MRTFSEFKRQVHESVRQAEGTLHANADMWKKFSLYTGGLVAGYALLLSGLLSGIAQLTFLTLYAFIVMGFMVNLLHDMIHGSFSKNPLFKSYFAYGLDLMGASSLVWKNKHNLSHHTYTNHSEIDNDLNVSAILRFTPDHPRHEINRFQHLYILPAYMLHTPFWFFVSDFKNIIRGRVTRHKLVGFDAKERFFFFLNKILHVVVALAIPAHFFGWTNALLAYGYVYGLIGLCLALIFQVAHVYEGSRFHKIEKFDSLEHWARIQIESSTIFAPGSRAAHWLYGGLNYQVLHHLFPEVCHIHYDRIYPMLRDYCAENGIQYTEFPSLASAVKSHLRQIYLLGQCDSPSSSTSGTGASLETAGKYRFSAP